ncbi:BAG domain-containing protein Samui isoform X2 [Cimex lectularius]|uniref:BAG domain-containing protein n=1 Tax=Cimex lectularius TaxID=79782 RepID=A0A8I6RLK6_CIMLE|nr:BAG domain-containing protein Samui isoform X2 [Cimex lectularius]
MESAPVIMDSPPLQGFPFDNDITSGKSTIDEHLDKLAQKHPEIAEQLKDWNTIQKRPRHEGPSSGTSSDNKEDVPDRQNEAHIAPKGASNLRNTVPDMQHNNQVQDEVDRAQRSQSAPPEAFQKEIPIQKNDYVNTNQSPNCTPPPHHNQHHQQGMRGPTVRHIPIFVEGRDEPLLPKEATETTSCPPHPQQHYQPQSANQQPMRPVRKQQRAQQDYSIPIPVQMPQAPPCAQPQPQQQQHQPSPQPPQNQNSPTPPPQAQSQSPPPPPRIDPLDQVAFVQKEVENLKEKIYSIKSIAKNDREYIYLDEMLTRNLLKLDNIEIEGREEVRAARKEAIKRIQECITTLESLPDTQQSTELACLTTASSESST